MGTQYRLYGSRHQGLTPVAFTFQTRVTDPDTGDETVTPIDLTARTITALARRYPDEDSEQVAELTVLPIDAAAGRIALLLSEEDAATQDVPAGSWWWDLRIDAGASDAWYPFTPSPFVWTAVVTTP